MQRNDKIIISIFACFVSLLSTNSFAWDLSNNTSQITFDLFNSDASDCKKLLTEGKNLNIAQRYCERAANNGNVEIQVKLGEIALSEKNYAKAKSWFEKSADKNNPIALFHLGALQENGLGEEVNKLSASLYYKQACLKNYAKACKRAEELALENEATKREAQLKSENAELEKQRRLAESQSAQQDVELEKSKLELEKAKQELAKLKAEAEKSQAEAQKAKAEAEKAKLSATYSTEAAPTPSSTASAQTTSTQSERTYYHGLAKFEQDGLWGYLDKQGNVVIPPRFAYASNFYSDGRAAVRNTQGLWGFIEPSGNYAISPRFCSVARFYEGLAGVNIGGYVEGDKCIGGKWGFIDPQGNVVIPAVLDEAQGFHKGKAKVTYQGQKGVINKQGQWVN